jgi:hypothetical protein
MNNISISRTPQQLAIRNTIDNLEQLMRDGIAEGALVETVADGLTKEGQDQCDHFFGDSVYARGLFIPKDTAVIGKLHKQARVCIIAQGECVFTDEFHSKRVKAPWIGEFNAGTKTAVYAITDTYWVACVGTVLTDPNKILEELSAKTFKDYNAFVQEKQELLKWHGQQ